MTNQPKQDDLDEILLPYHSHSCHSRQQWVKGMTQPFPCDCDVTEAKHQIQAKIDAAVADNTFRVVQNLVKSGAISDRAAATVLSLYTAPKPGEEK